jgi:hypothetical protein
MEQDRATSLNLMIDCATHFFQIDTFLAIFLSGVFIYDMYSIHMHICMYVCMYVCIQILAEYTIKLHIISYCNLLFKVSKLPK